MANTVSEGSAYSRKPSTYNAKLTEVGRGTPMGELLRRYWHPVGLSIDAGGTPLPVRALGEDLILFRDGAGRPGLVHNRCCHRGTTLYYGRIEERGIRCCYHGWLFDVQGKCLEQPAEPELGAKFRDRVRQPWYPVQERYGLIFAYMGPLEKIPALPRWKCLEELEDGEFIDVDDNSIGGGGSAIVPCNWMQHFENIADPYHVPILHGSFSGIQFTELMNTFPQQLEFSLTERGVKIRSVRTLADGRVLNRITEGVLPTVRAVPSPLHGVMDIPVETLGWVLPIDDTHFRIYTAGRVREKGVFLRKENGEPYDPRARLKMSDEERRVKPNDWEAQVGQGPVTFHSEEHLASSDRGIIMLRRMFEQQVGAVANGQDPIGVSFDEQAAPLELEAGNWLVK